MHSEASEARWLLTCSWLSCVPFLPEKANLRGREFCLVIRTWTFSRRATWRHSEYNNVSVLSQHPLPHHSPFLLASTDTPHLYLMLFSIGQTFTTMTEHLTSETLGRNHLFWVMVQRFLSVVTERTQWSRDSENQGRAYGETDPSRVHPHWHSLHPSIVYSDFDSSDC